MPFFLSGSKTDDLLITMAASESAPLLKPIPNRKRKRDEVQGICILCNEECDEDKSNLSAEAWERMKDKAKDWKDLPKFGNVYDTINWEAGPNGVFFHKRCRTALASQRGLQQAVRKKENLQKQLTEETQGMHSQEQQQSSGRSSRSSGLLHGKQLCIWCMKPEDLKHSNKLCIIQQWNAWNTFKGHTIHLEDTQMRDRILSVIDSTPDPFASEIRYHRSCWVKYVKPFYKSSGSSSDQMHLQNVRLTEVREMFFKHVRKVVLEMNEPRTLQGLLVEYNQISSNFGFESVTKTSTIKQMLQNEFKDKIGFHDRFHKNQSTIAYDASAGGSYIEAAIYSWGVSNEQLLNNVARRLRETLKEDEGLPWPLRVDELESFEEPHKLLGKLLTWLKDPDSNDFTEACDDPQVVALSSLLFSFITGKRTSFQANLSVTLHGLTRSREIIDILRKFALGISYKDVLDLYNAWTMDDIKANTTCPDELADGFPGTGVLDNDDFKDDTLTGADTTHRTNVMFVQPEYITPIESEKDRPILSLAKSDDVKNLSTSQHKVHPYKTVNRGQPAVRKEIDISLQTSDEQRKRGVMHALARLDIEGKNIPSNEQKVGSFAGFQANIHEFVVKSTAYYFLTFPKPPQKSVVHEVMCRMVAAAEHKSMPFIQLVGDQPVYALIVQLKNENPHKFELILPFLGPFHTHISFISAINKRFDGSGLSEILVAADIISEGSVHQALRGKHYNRAIRCLTLMYEVLIRRVICRGFSEGLELSSELKSKLEVLRNPPDSSQGQLQAIVEDLLIDAEFESFVHRAFESIQKADSSMAKFWLSFIDMVETLIMNIYALRTQNWEAFKASLRMMLPWLRIYDNDKYSRWLTEFWLEISSLPKENERYMREGLFSQSMTGKPYSCLPLDLWIEMTMNKGSKMKAGWKRILKNEKMLLTHTRTVNSVNRVRSSLHALANLKESSKGHKENTTARLFLDERGVQDLESCIKEFDCDPFDLTKPILRSLQSGMVASDELVADFDTAHSDGESLVQSFFKERMFSNEKKFDATIHRNSRHSFSKPPVAKDASKQKATKTDAMENKAMAEIITLAQNLEDGLVLSEVMEHRVTEECLPIFNVNGTMRKGQKSKLVERFNFVELDPLDSYIAIVDMGFIWRLSTPSAEDREKQDESTYTWADYATKMFNLIVKRHPKSSKIILVNDPYDLTYNIKDSEHERRTGEISFVGGTRNIFIKRNDELPSPKQFNNMFKNSGNKIRLQQFLKAEFKTLVLQHPGTTFIYSVRERCCDLSTDVELDELTCKHMEADTIMFYIYSQLRNSGVSDAVVIDAEDTDVIVLASYVAHQIEGTLGLKRKKGIFNCASILAKEIADIIIPFHIHTGADAISSFYGHGKPSVFDTAMKSSEARELLKGLGKYLPVTLQTQKDLEQFTIKYVYKDRTSKTLAEARAKKWETMKRKSTLRIPPDTDSHNFKVTRANYQAFIMLNFMNPDAPSSPLQHGWILREGKCLPERYSKPALPQCLRNARTNSIEESNTDSDTSECNSDSDSASDGYLTE